MTLAQQAVAEFENAREFFNRSTRALTEAQATTRPTPGMMTATQQIAHAAQTIDWFVDGAFSPKGFDTDFEALGKALEGYTSLAADEPHLVLDADGFLRDAFFRRTTVVPSRRCHRPLVVRDARQSLGTVLGQLVVHSERPGDDVIDHDLVLVWTPDERRVITGADILGRLLRGIARVAPKPPPSTTGGNA